MCFKNFFKPKPPISATSKRKALFFAINNYKGNKNDLNGCVNDQSDWIERLNQEWPDFDIRAFMDKDVTVQRFILEVTNAIASLNKGDSLLIHYSGHGTQYVDTHDDEEDGYDEAIYLYDGCVIDDNIGKSLMAIPEGATVLLLFDSCFSGTVTRNLQGDHPKKSKYVQNTNIPKQYKKNVRFAPEEMKWMVISGCSEQETSADAYIDGKYNGAFTHFCLKALEKNMTYLEWYEKIRTYLPRKEYSQTPTIEGRTSLFSKVVFT